MDPFDEDPFDFAQLPSNLQCTVVEKLEYSEFVIFDRCSRLAHFVCNKKDCSFQYEVTTIFVNKKSLKVYVPERMSYMSFHVFRPTRIVAGWVVLPTRVSSHRVQTVTKLFVKHKTSAEMLGIRCEIGCDPADLDRLMKVLNVSHFNSLRFVPRQFFDLESMQNMARMTPRSSDFDDSQLLKLKCKYMCVDNDFLTAEGLNLFLKQWKNREREIDLIRIVFDTSFDTRDSEAILDGLNANAIWTPEMHEHSIVGKIELYDFALMGTDDPEHLFSLFRCDDIGDTRILTIRKGRVEVRKEEKSEEMMLLNYLHEDQYYLIKGRCRLCDLEHCQHTIHM